MDARNSFYSNFEDTHREANVTAPTVRQFPDNLPDPELPSAGLNSDIFESSWTFEDENIDEPASVPYPSLSEQSQVLSSSDNEQNKIEEPGFPSPLGYKIAQNPPRHVRKQLIKSRDLGDEEEDDSNELGSSDCEENLLVGPKKHGRKRVKAFGNIRSSFQLIKERLLKLIPKNRTAKAAYHFRKREVKNIEAKSFQMLLENDLYDILSSNESNWEDEECLEKRGNLLAILDESRKLIAFISK